MEFASLHRPATAAADDVETARLRRPATAAADDVETARLRRFAHLQPPSQGAGTTNASLVDAALSRRREELLWELNKARIHQNMILLELVETEHAMGFTAAIHNPVPLLPSSQDYWRFRMPLVPPLEEAPLRSPHSSTEHSHCGNRGPTAVRVPPMYPYVELSLSPLLQTRPASDTEKKQDCRSSGARTHSFDGYVELGGLPNKRTLAEEASVPAAADSGARPTFREVTPGHKDAVGRECKDDVEHGYGYGVPPFYKSGNQSSGQGKAAETSPVDEINGAILQSSRYRLERQESAAFYQQKGREFSVQTPEQPRLDNGAEQQQEYRSPGAGAHLFSGYRELSLSSSKQAPVKENLVPVMAKAKEAASGYERAFGGEPKAAVDDGCSMQPLVEIKNQSSGQRKAVESAIEGWTDKLTQLPGQHRPVGLENAAYNEQKVEFSELSRETTSVGVKRKLNAETSPAKKQKPLGKHSCILCHVNTPSPCHLEEHLGGKLHRSNLTALLSSRNTATNTESLHQDGRESAMESSGSQQGWKPHSFRRSKAPDAAKKADPKSALYCKVCKLQCNSEKMLADHLRGRRHRETLEESPLYCRVCDVMCNSEKMLADHLGGRKHREKADESD